MFVCSVRPFFKDCCNSFRHGLSKKSCVCESSCARQGFAGQALPALEEADFEKDFGRPKTSWFAFIIIHDVDFNIYSRNSLNQLDNLEGRWLQLPHRLHHSLCQPASWQLSYHQLRLPQGGFDIHFSTENIEKYRKTVEKIRSAIAPHFCLGEVSGWPHCASHRHHHSSGLWFGRCLNWAAVSLWQCIQWHFFVWGDVGVVQTATGEEHRWFPYPAGQFHPVSLLWTWLLPFVTTRMLNSWPFWWDIFDICWSVDADWTRREHLHILRSSGHVPYIYIYICCHMLQLWQWCTMDITWIWPGCHVDVTWISRVAPRVVPSLANNSLDPIICCLLEEPKSFSSGVEKKVPRPEELPPDAFDDAGKIKAQKNGSRAAEISCSLGTRISKKAKFLKGDKCRILRCELQKNHWFSWRMLCTVYLFLILDHIYHSTHLCYVNHPGVQRIWFRRRQSMSSKKLMLRTLRSTACGTSSRCPGTWL